MLDAAYTAYQHDLKCAGRTIVELKKQNHCDIIISIFF